MTDRQWSLYIIETRTGTLYTGITTDVDRRLREHEQGKGAKYLRGKGPLSLKFTHTCPDRSSATQLEIQVKRLSKPDKLVLIKSPSRLEELLATD